MALEFARRYQAVAGSPPPGSTSQFRSPPKLGGPAGTDTTGGLTPGDNLTTEVPRPVIYETEAHRHVHEAYSRVGGNVAAIEKELRAGGIKYSRRRISRLMDELVLPRIRRG